MELADIFLSVHAGESKGFLPKTWDNADRVGHAKARDLFASFAGQCFGTSEFKIAEGETDQE